MSKTPSVLPSATATPAPSSPPPSESNFSELDGTAPSILDGTEFRFSGLGWDGSKDSSGAGLNLVSWKLDVNAHTEDGVEKRGFNAISTVLNHPTKKANPLRSSRKPLPPLNQPLQTLPKPPPPSHYDPYLKAVTPLYETFLAAQAASTSTLHPPPLTGQYDLKPPTPHPDLPNLKSVPDIFFDTNFDLANPSTWATLVDDNTGTTEDTQDILSTHLDTLERHLIHEITLRSTSFFSALSNLQDLHSESSSCLKKISDLQNGLRDVGSKQARKGLEIIAAQEELRMLRITEHGIQDVGELEELLRMTRSLVELGDWANGLNCLGDVVRWWEKHVVIDQLDLSELSSDQGPSSPRKSKQSLPHIPNLPLSTLPALASLPDALDELTKGIAEQLEAALESLLLSMFSEDDAPPIEAESFRDRVKPMMEGLARCGHLEGVSRVWSETVTRAIREGSRKHLPISVPEEDGVEDSKPTEMRGATLAAALRSMDHARFLLLSSQLYKTMLARLHLTQKMGEYLSDVLSSVKSIPSLSMKSLLPTSPAPPETPPTIDLPETLASACELANLRASKILSVRSEQHASLPINEFIEMFKENWQFVQETESLSNRMIVSLRGVTASQARTFLIVYHSARLTRSAKLVEEELWTQVDVEKRIQGVVDLFVEASVSDPGECFIPPKPSVEIEDEKIVGNGENGDVSPDVKAKAGETGPSKTLNVEDKSFYVVKATAESLVLLGDYLKVVINLELVATDVMGRIIEFLKSFNSRTCQVVLGAGAMRSAGLKNITAKHLALASQSLSVIINLIPYIREFIRRHLSPKQAVMLTEFDKLKRDYQEHQNEIHAKLVAIMSDRLSVHVGSLREIDWEATPAKDGPRSYAEMLVKETATLHKVLSKYLAPTTVETVMLEVLAAIAKRLSEEYSKIELKSEDAKKRMTQDASLLHAKLATLAETGSTLSNLETLVKEKPLPKKAMGEAVKGFFGRGGTKEAAAPDTSGVEGADAEGRTSTEQAGAGDEDADGEGDGDVDVLTAGKAASARASLEVPPPEGKTRTSEEAKRSSESLRLATTAPPGVAVAEAVASPALTLDTLVVDQSTPGPVERAASPAPPVIQPVERTLPATDDINRLKSPPPRTSSTSPRPLSPNLSPRPFSPPARLGSPTPHNAGVPGFPFQHTSSTSPAGSISTPTQQRHGSNSPAAGPASPLSPTTEARTRAPRVSLANRLKGVVTRAGSTEPAETPGSTSTAGGNVIPGETTFMSPVQQSSEKVGGDPSVLFEMPPAVPDKDKDKDKDEVVSPPVPDKQTQPASELLREESEIARSEAEPPSEQVDDVNLKSGDVSRTKIPLNITSGEGIRMNGSDGQVEVVKLASDAVAEQQHEILS